MPICMVLFFSRHGSDARFHWNCTLLILLLLLCEMYYVGNDRCKSGCGVQLPFLCRGFQFPALSVQVCSWSCGSTTYRFRVFSQYHKSFWPKCLDGMLIYNLNCVNHWIKEALFLTLPVYDDSSMHSSPLCVLYNIHVHQFKFSKSCASL